MNQTNNNQDENSEVEIDLSRPGDRLMLEQSADAVLYEIIQYESIAMADGYNKLTQPGFPGDEFFKTAREKFDLIKKGLAECQRFVEKEDVIEDEFVDRLQAYYNDIVELRDHVCGIYKSDQIFGENEIEKESVEEQIQKKQGLEMSKTAPVKADEDGSVARKEMDGSVVIDDISLLLDKTIPAKEKKDETNQIKAGREEELENSESFQDVHDELGENSKSDALLAEIDEVKLLSEKVFLEIKKSLEDLSIALPKVSQTKSQTINLNELSTVLKRAETIKKQVVSVASEQEDESVAKSKVSRYKRILSEVQKNAETLVAVLSEAVKDHNQEDEAIKKNDRVASVLQTELVDNSKSTSLSEEGKVTEINPSDSKRGDESVGGKDVVAIGVEGDEDEIGYGDFRVLKERQGKNIAVKKEVEVGSSVPINVRRKPSKFTNQNNSQNSNNKHKGDSNDILKTQDKYRNQKANKSEESGEKVQEDKNTGITNHASISNLGVRKARPDSLSEKYLSDKKYKEFIEEYYASPAAFDSFLRAAIEKIERGTNDPIERWLGESYQSPFRFLEILTIQELIDLSNASDIRKRLERKKIKYETFLVWVDLIDDMLLDINAPKSMKFGKLFAMWIIESEMSYSKDEKADLNSQFDTNESLTL